MTPRRDAPTVYWQAQFGRALTRSEMSHLCNCGETMYWQAQADATVSVTPLSHVPESKKLPQFSDFSSRPWRNCHPRG